MFVNIGLELIRRVGKSGILIFIIFGLIVIIFGILLSYFLCILGIFGIFSYFRIFYILGIFKFVILVFGEKKVVIIRIFFKFFVIFK